MNENNQPLTPYDHIERKFMTAFPNKVVKPITYPKATDRPFIEILRDGKFKLFLASARIEKAGCIEDWQDWDTGEVYISDNRPYQLALKKTTSDEIFEIEVIFDDYSDDFFMDSSEVNDTNRIDFINKAKSELASWIFPAKNELTDQQAHENYYKNFFQWIGDDLKALKILLNGVKPSVFDISKCTPY